MLSTQLLQHYPPAVLKSANTLWLLRYRPDEIPFLRDNFGVGSHPAALPENAGRGRTGRQRCPGTGCVPCKNGTLARILKFTLGPLELWALNSSLKTAPCDVR